MPLKQRIALSAILLPLISWGQAAPPPEVEQALRARVTEFLQYHVDGNFRKAYDMVAEDTKDDYFASGKVQLKGFQINDVRFTDNFTKAEVSGTISKTFSVAGQDMPVTVPSTTTWKVENGKWVWYKEAQETRMTPMGPSLAGAPGTAPPLRPFDAAGLPPKLDDKAVAAAGESILQQVSVDKKVITLATDKPSEERVVFHNGMTGSVQLELTAPEIPGFSAKIEQAIVRAAADVPVVFRYEPGDSAGRRDPVTVRLTVEPLNQVFTIRVNFSAPGPLK